MVAITLPVVVVGLSLLLIPVYCFFFANQMSAHAPSSKELTLAPLAFEASLVPETEVFFDVMALEDSTANV